MSSWLFVTQGSLGVRETQRHHILEVPSKPRHYVAISDGQEWAEWWFNNVGPSKNGQQATLIHSSIITGPIEMDACVTFVQHRGLSSVG